MFEPPSRIYPGRMQINWRHPITKDLTFFKVFDNFGVPLFSKQPCYLSPNGTDWLLTGSPNGPGVCDTSNAVNHYLRDASCAFPMATRGSAFVYSTINFSPTDGGEHLGMVIGATNATINSGGTSFHIIKYSDNNWYVGFYKSGSDTRAVAAASGTYSTGTGVMAGGTWVINGTTTMYVAGKQVTTHASPATTPAAVAALSVGGWDDGTAYTWCKDGKTFIHYAAIWDRDLNAEEVKYINFNPYCFLTSWYRVSAFTRSPGALAQYYEMMLGNPNPFGPRTQS